MFFSEHSVEPAHRIWQLRRRRSAFVVVVVAWWRRGRLRRRGRRVERCRRLVRLFCRGIPSPTTVAEDLQAHKRTSGGRVQFSCSLAVCMLFFMLLCMGGPCCRNSIMTMWSVVHGKKKFPVARRLVQLQTRAAYRHGFHNLVLHMTLVCDRLSFRP